MNSSGYAVYNDGVKVRSGLELNGNLTTMDGLIGFVTDKADYLALGLGVSFWDNKALENTYVKNIKLYEKSLDDAALAELFGTEITEADIPQQPVTVKISADGLYYSLDYAEEFTKTIGTENAIDAFTYQSKIIHDASAKIQWKNPLYGMKEADLSNGITFQVDVYSLDIEGINGFDNLIGFYTPDDDWDVFGIYEGGAVHINSGTMGGYFDNMASLKKASWVTVSVVFDKDGTITFYQDGKKVSDGDQETLFEGEHIAVDKNYSKIVKYFTERATHVGVGVGGIWAAGYVDEGSGIKDIRIYPTAIKYQ